MNNLRPTLALLSVFLFSTFSFSQITIWEEDFSTYPDETVDDFPRWTITSSATVNTTFNSLDPDYRSHFWVVSGDVEARDNNGEEQVFETQTIDISSFLNVNAVINFSENGVQEATDYIHAYFVLDGGPEVPFTTNGLNFDDFTSVTARQSGVVGNDLKIVIRVSNSSLTEYHYINNITITGSTLVSPGAVENDIVMWLKANDGITTSGSEVTAWGDKSQIVSYSAVKEGISGFSGPELINESLNFNPALRFDGTDYLAIDYTDPLANGLNIDPANGDNMTVFSVFSLNDADSEGTIISKGIEKTRNYQVWLGEFDRVMHYTLGRDDNGSGDQGHHWGDGTLDARYEAKVSTGVIDGVVTSYLNSTQDTYARNDGIGSGTSNMDILVGARRESNNTDVGFLLKGDLAELIVYNEALSTAEIDKVESYLAIKYGITLGYNDSQVYSGTSDNYYASDGTVLWDGAANAGWGYNVFGIARDDDSSLLQLKSKSVNVQRDASVNPPLIFDAILTMESEAGAIVNDKGYLLIGHNGGNIALQTATVPIRSQNLLERLWVSRESVNDVGNVTLTFNLSQYTGTTINNPSNLDLYVSDNSLMNNYCNYEGSYNNTTGELTFTGINLKETEYFTLGTPDVISASNHIEFDGVDDYISTPGFLDGLQEVTLMAWVKIDPSNNGVLTSKTVLGEDVSCRITIAGGNNPSFSVRTDTTPTIGVNGGPINYDEWHHITGTFSGITGEQKIYIDGQLEQISGTDFTGASIQTTAFHNGNFEIGKHARNSGDQEFFPGGIEEVRVFDSALTEDQIQQLIYQEIEQNSTNVRGSIIPKDIEDFSTSNNLSWSSLKAYYPMTTVRGNTLMDESSESKNAKLRAIENTIVSQTAPIPYETVANGPWTTEANWLHGDVWDIEDITNNKPWSIVHIKNDVTTVSSHTQLGMFIDADKTLTVGDINSDNQNFEINNSWYLQLDGTLDLQDDSQLIQGANSDLVTSATGKILRRQEGNSSVFWYNYWSSPVGNPSATSLTNNNGTINNANNSPFNLAMIKDGTETALEFTSSFDEVGKISNRWLYSFQNGQDYYDWIALTPASEIAPGIGYTQKGTGVLNANNKQEYIFDGKPNNGTILIAADDVDGDSATESDDGSRTTTLIGNPYPSALDARQFIADNSATINGTILLWEQWAGNSHILAEYEGGYGYINAMTTERAYQYAGVEIADPMTDPSGEGIKRPTFYIPVGQGFFVEVVEDGDIEFNNTQRVFIKEGDALIDQDDPNYAENGSSFFRNANNQSSQTSQENEEENPYQLIRMEFKTSAGDSRRFVLGFSETATDGFDYGLDGGYIDDVPEEDMGSIFEGKQYAIQAFAPITPEKEIDLNLNASGNHTYSIKAVEFSNLSEVQNVYLRDNLTGTYFDLRNGDAYEFTSPAGAYNDRFDVVFKAEETLSTDSFNSSKVLIYNNRLEHKLYIKGLDQDAKNLSLTNIIGQTVKSMVDVSVNKLENGFFIGDLSSGVYLVNIKTQDNSELSKKIILE